MKKSNFNFGFVCGVISMALSGTLVLVLSLSIIEKEQLFYDSRIVDVWGWPFDCFYQYCMSSICISGWIIRGLILNAVTSILGSISFYYFLKIFGTGSD